MNSQFWFGVGAVSFLVVSLLLLLVIWDRKQRLTTWFQSISHVVGIVLVVLASVSLLTVGVWDIVHGLIKSGAIVVNDRPKQEGAQK